MTGPDTAAPRSPAVRTASGTSAAGTPYTRWQSRSGACRVVHAGRVNAETYVDQCPSKVTVRSARRA
uniref:hypothetical protein n=1 Tax=Streptomyces sp. SS7 TaxID=3108485 RepID=UPI0040402441